jgi:hypothetical protein
VGFNWKFRIPAKGSNPELARGERQHRLGMVEREDAGLFVHAKHHGVVGRRHVKADNLKELLLDVRPAVSDGTAVQRCGGYCSR